MLAADRETLVKDEKITQIEVELQDIADQVRNNIGKIFERGEKMGTLASKSEALRAKVSILGMCVIRNIVADTSEQGNKDKEGS
jgi:hypothetical protein